MLFQLCSISAPRFGSKATGASRRGTHYVLRPYVLRRSRKRLFSIARQPHPAILSTLVPYYSRDSAVICHVNAYARAVLNQTHWSGRGHLALRINTVTSLDNPLIRPPICDARCRDDVRLSLEQKYRSDTDYRRSTTIKTQSDTNNISLMNNININVILIKI